MKELVLDQLRSVAETLAILRTRVREAVAGEVSRAVAEAVAEVLSVTLRGPLTPARFIDRAARYGRYGVPPKASYGRPDWDDPEVSEWDDPALRDERTDGHNSANAPHAGSDAPAALVLALTAGRWWLLRRGSPWGAAGVGLLVGGALLAGGPVARTALGVLWAIDRLLAATDAVGDGARSLDRT
jgi:hypothetical protein